MKFETTTEQLGGAAATAARFSERRPNLPVLATLLLALKGNGLTIRATNLECGVEVTLTVKGQGDGTVAVPAHVVTGFLGNARGKLMVALEGEVLKLKTERASATIKTVPHADFPVLPRVSATTSFVVKAGDLVRAIRSVAYCASLSAVKPELQSVLLYGEAGKLTAVATDSFRLAEKTVPLKKGGSVPQLLIPARNAAELMKILEGEGGDVELYYNEHQLSTQVEGVYYTSRLLDGAFPNYKQIIPKKFETEAMVLRDDFSQALKALSVFADKFSQVLLAVEPKHKAVQLTSRNPDVGEQVSTVKATVDGGQVNVSFNGRYLADSLQAIGGASVRLYSNGPGKAMLIKDAGDDSFLYLAMPMNR
ncbi:MAG: DNA polymerase III subunit beta [Patescibacteria group bacterium]|nr:DNA polymerase III subunit beta [Patescibacteria group bacterium]